MYKIILAPSPENFWIISAKTLPNKETYKPAYIEYEHKYSKSLMIFSATRKES